MRSARAATFAVFAITGAVSATWAVRIPAVQERLDLSPAELALAILGVEAGAIAGLPLGAAITARAGSRTTLRFAFAVFPAALAVVARAPGLGSLAAALALFAAANSVVDVAMNAQGVELERRARRPVLSSLHAGHPLGLIAGGLAGTAAAAAGLGVPVHFTAVAAAGVAVALVATRRLVREPPRPPGRLLTRPGRPLALLGLVAFCATVVTSVAENWSAVAMRAGHGAGQAAAAATFTAYALALAAGRAAGDRLVERVVRAGAVVGAAGAAAAVLSPWAPGAVAGWVLVGAGLATATPAVIGAAPGLAAMPVPAAIAAITSISYLGSFTGPPLVGVLAGAVGLSAALSLMVVAAVAMAALAGPGLRPAPRSRQPAGGS